MSSAKVFWVLLDLPTVTIGGLYEPSEFALHESAYWLCWDFGAIQRAMVMRYGFGDTRQQLTYALQRALEVSQ